MQNTIVPDPHCQPDDVRHDGIIESVGADYVKVNIVQQSACVSCQVKGACNVGEMSREVVEVPNHGYTGLKPGDRVQVYMRRNLGLKAVLLGYLLPFIILLVTMITVREVTGSDGWAGLSALGVLIPYYLVLSLFRKKVNRTFTFAISK
ncbi:MAG: SoxR reducing system RseC family protein [Bacteroidales bacterium]